MKMLKVKMKFSLNKLIGVHLDENEKDMQRFTKRKTKVKSLHFQIDMSVIL